MVNITRTRKRGRVYRRVTLKKGRASSHRRTKRVRFNMRSETRRQTGGVYRRKPAKKTIVKKPTGTTHRPGSSGTGSTSSKRVADKKASDKKAFAWGLLPILLK